MINKNFEKDEISAIKTWGASHITAILKYLGIAFSDRGQYLTGKCPIPSHGGDRTNNKAFIWSFAKGRWHCYSHQCHEDTSTDVIGLVMSMREMAFPQAIKLLKELQNGELQNAPIEPIQNRYTTPTTENYVIDESKLRILLPDTYFHGRGISETTLKKHNVGYWQKVGTFMDRRAIVPVYDIESKLVGFSGRLLENSTDQAKWVHGKDFVTRKAGEFHKGSVLYNLNNCKEIVQKIKKVFIVEGPIDVWKMEMAGIYNVVATLGLGLSFEQQKLLISLGVDTLVICYDNDEHKAGEKAANRIKEQVATMFTIEIKLPPNSSKDYGEMSTSDILERLL